MLYFVYNESVISVFVAHDIRRGVWVAQLPFFPPFQSPSDFPPEKCKEMILAGLGIDDGSLVTIKAMKPWTMTSQVASSYGSAEQNVFLVGDSAHLFPPAGGFGMNTGLQDSHNLAWKLAAVVKGKADKTVLGSYESERRPVALANAALSERNYERTLKIAQVLGLNAQHPKFVVNAIQSLSFLSDSLKKSAFQTLVDTAMFPLRILASGTRNPVVSALKEKIQGILDRGEGLPLLFPKYELGYVYGEVTSDPAIPQDDTALYEPVLKVGARMPHCNLKRSSDGTEVSTLSLCASSDVKYVALSLDVGAIENGREIDGLPVDILKVGQEKSVSVDLEDTLGHFKALCRAGDVTTVVVRPDGHIHSCW